MSQQRTVSVRHKYSGEPLGAVTVTARNGKDAARRTKHEGILAWRREHHDWQTPVAATLEPVAT